MDPVAAFHRLEDLVDRHKLPERPARSVRALRQRLPTMRTAAPHEWVSFYSEAVAALRTIDEAPADKKLSPGERRYVEGLLNDVREVPSSVFELWARRLQDQRDELMTKAREEVGKLTFVQDTTATAVRLQLSAQVQRRWTDWLDQYLDLWTHRVTTEVPAGIHTAQAEHLSRAPSALAALVPRAPAAPTEPAPAKLSSEWSELSKERSVAGAWSLFGRSVRGGIFLVMMLATVGASVAAAFGGSGTAIGRGLIVLLLLVPVLVWARITSQTQRSTAVETAAGQLENDLRSRLLQLTQNRVDGQYRALRGWLQRVVRAAKSEAQVWMRKGQLQLSAAEAHARDERVYAAAHEIISALEARIADLSTADRLA